ncbi:MAG: cell division protein FtsA [Lachnospiraceae bacterium]|nr:cell division protein FtsA [Lachnospiraceae bacterium]
MSMYEAAPVFGLDIGTRSVVGTIGYKRGDNFVVVAQEIREHQTRAMLDGQIHDINRVAATIAEIKEALEKKSGLELRDVCIAAAGRVLKTLDVHIDMDFEKEHNVTKDDISTLASLGVEKAFRQFKEENDTDARFYCVGYSVVKYYLNGMWMGQPEHHKAKNIGCDMIATFLPDDVVDGLYCAVELAGLKVANMTLEPIAAIRVAIPEKFRLLNIAMIDVGAGTSDISVTSDGSVAAFGMIPCAGDTLTESLARQCLIDFATAEQIKKDAMAKSVITYEDIMGLEQTVTAEEVIAMCQAEIEKMAKLAADEIKRLNGGNSPSAVFIVGGGGKIQGFSEQIAVELGLDPKRVALRGEEIMKEVEFPEDALKDSTIVTPIGICLSYYEQTNNFIHVTFNGNKVKLYDNNKLAVVDAAVQASFPHEDLFPKQGAELHYTVNGKNRVSKGEYGEGAKIFVNGEEVDMGYAIKANDEIVMQESTAGAPASVKIEDLVDYNGRIHVTVDGAPMELHKPVKVNDNEVTGEYEIQENDEIFLCSYYSHEQMLKLLNLNPEKVAFLINGVKASKDTAIYDGDVITTQSIMVKPVEEHTVSEEKKDAVHVFRDMIDDAAKNENTKEETEKVETDEQGNARIVIICNQKPLVLEGRKVYRFVDLFDYIDFDTSKMRGNGIVTKVNGEKAQYTQELKNGDKVEIYWS